MKSKCTWLLAGTLGLTLLAGTVPVRAGAVQQGNGQSQDQVCRSLKLQAVVGYFGCLVKAGNNGDKQSVCDNQFARRFEAADRRSPGCGPLDNLRRTQLGVQKLAQEVLIGAITQPPCATVLVSGSQVVCQMVTPGKLTGVSEVNLDDVLAQVQQTNPNITASTVMWMQTWGGSGGPSLDYNHEGVGGFAQTVTSISDLEGGEGTSTLYYYLGGKGGYSQMSGGSGGAATLVTTQNLLLNPSDAPAQKFMLMIAAGGGGSGGNGNCTPSPEYGGAGGVAIATTAEPGEDQGQNGSGGIQRSGNGGGQGIGGANAPGGEHGYDGIGGNGGHGGAGFQGSAYAPGWLNTGTTSLTFSTGHGGFGDNKTGVCDSGGGGGGGGWGGGGGGNHGDTSEHAGSGGGGGSYAIASTQSDANAPTSIPSNPNGGFGFFQLVFDLNPTQ